MLSLRNKQIVRILSIEAHKNPRFVMHYLKKRVADEPEFTEFIDVMEDLMNSEIDIDALYKKHFQPPLSDTKQILLRNLGQQEAGGKH